ncbi:uncharacterized protein LOC114301970 [Camellia sinensis]|uniref:Uncharacterized protein n=1 Tax=Camellia sinensis var. sinensis TaxID=542762 RepID=A0A4S4F253_CAMSN|nr:uncharacterized protein LOC114301970 [Camellia sinensis]THG23549.1 hypothetical protein TEA_003918 [Camellia sinensis var. sinensis]
MSSILNSQGVVLATAMAVSGTVIILALRLQKSFPATQFNFNSIHHHSPPPPLPRSCISSEEKKREKKKKKRVQFAEDVVDPVGNSEEFRRQHINNRNSNGLSSNSSSKITRHAKKSKECRRNRKPLFCVQGILRDRLVHHRLAYSD